MFTKYPGITGAKAAGLLKEHGYNELPNGLAAAMALLPEEFPVVLTIFLALGAWRLSKNKVLTRSPSAIETLGSATVLCAEKTGTITQNKMEVAGLFYRNKIFQKDEFLRDQKEIGDFMRVLFYASQTNSIDPMEKAIHWIVFTSSQKKATG